MNDGRHPFGAPGPDAPALIRVLRAACLDGPTLRMTALPARVVRWGLETGLGPLLERAVADDPEAAASPLWPLVRGANLTARFVTADRMAAMTDILDACDGKIAPPILLKGISLCDEHYAEPHLRPMRDIDFLMEADAIPAVESILRRLGYSQWAGRSPAFYAGHHHSAPFVHPDTGVWLDVHRALFAAGGELGTDRTFSFANVHTQLRWSEFRGRPVRRLSDELQLVHLACHWARGLRAVGGMVAMADLAFVLRHRPDIDWERILAWTDASRAARYLCLLLTYLDRHRVIDIAPEILHRLCAAHRSPGRLTLRVAYRLLDRYVVEGHDFGVLMTQRTFARLWRILVLRQPRRAPPGPAGRPTPTTCGSGGGKEEASAIGGRAPEGLTAPPGNANQRGAGGGRGRCR